MGYPDRLAGEGLGDGAIPYAVGKLVLWANGRSAIDAPTAKMNSLLHPSVRRIAIANPKHAPYGRAAVESMKQAGLFDKVQSRLVMGENVTQAAQFAHTGAAQVGLIALSLALTDKLKSSGSFWEIPATHYRPIDQGYLLLKRSRSAGEAKAFADFVTGPEGREILKRYGFGLPE
jgi:molybdate transport system substrate-binding protein